MINAFTIDVEDYYCLVRRHRLGCETPPSEAVDRCTRQLMDLLDRFRTKGTFFFLGEVARAYPQLVRDVAAGGHELGVHGFRHVPVYTLSPEQFRREIVDAKRCLEDLSGAPVVGHRAPAFSFRADTLWAFDVLLDEGFLYDSSVHPAAGVRYGWPGFLEDIHEMTLPSGRKIVEAPMSVVHFLGRTLPACGGGWLRHFPYGYTRWAMRRISKRRPVIVYVHPHEIDTEPAPEYFRRELAQAARAHKRHHRIQTRNRRTVMGKLEKLLGSYPFAPLRDVIGRALGRPLSTSVAEG